jgi:ATP-dependent Clp protease adaptor protein ClpS
VSDTKSNPEVERSPGRYRRAKTGRKTSSEPPWNVVLHNDWDNSMVRVVVVLKKVIPGMTVGRATSIMYEAHSRGRAVVKRCHRELAELYQEKLEGEGLSATAEPAG